MGMAASQARYLALVARKSNCEYEGQQINQARTALSNQSANLFNQMLGLDVPVPPSTRDFSKTQYSYKDGTNTSTISDWQQLSSADPDYNYVVTHYYYTDRYTGSQKKLSDPQVQFSAGTGTSGTDIKKALDLITKNNAAYLEAKAAREAKEKEAATLANYADQISGITNSTYTSSTSTYSVTNADGVKNYVNYSAASVSDDVRSKIDNLIKNLVDEGAIDSKYATDKSDIYYDSAADSIAFGSDLKNLVGNSSGSTGTILPTYNITSTNGKINQYNNEISDLKNTENTKLDEYNKAVNAYEALSVPTYIGNSELTPLASLSEDQKAEINQIISDMKEQGINDSLSECFDNNGNYIGGIYSFKLNGITYYTTYSDLVESYNSGTGNNHIDGQTKLTYYNATYVSTKVEETEKALLETDGNGRFTSIRFENDSVTYTLSMETITDDAAYQDAMNQYYYDNAVYDKTVQDINAKTSLIQQEDLQLELRLKQLDTEQNALSTEIDAVKKVVDDNVESSFKTFGG